MGADLRMSGGAGVAEERSAVVRSDTVGNAPVGDLTNGMAASVCCGGRVSGISTGPLRRGGRGSVVRRSEPVCGRAWADNPVGEGIGWEGPKAGGNGPVEGRAPTDAVGAFVLGSELLSGRVPAMLEPSDDVAGREEGRGLVSGRVVEVVGWGVMNGGGVAVDELVVLSVLGSGSVAGRTPTSRGIICDNGFSPPGFGGRLPIGVNEEAR